MGSVEAVRVACLAPFVFLQKPVIQVRTCRHHADVTIVTYTTIINRRWNRNLIRSRHVWEIPNIRQSPHLLVVRV